MPSCGRSSQTRATRISPGEDRRAGWLNGIRPWAATISEEEAAVTVKGVGRVYIAGAGHTFGATACTRAAQSAGSFSPRYSSLLVGRQLPLVRPE